jgi:hypothetical protein
MNDFSKADLTKSRPGRRGEFGFGKGSLPVDERRSIRVEVLLNAEEAKLLDEYRGKIPRSEYLRSAGIGKLRPMPVPKINQEAWFTLSKSAGNLATLAKFAAEGVPIEFDQIRREVNEFRRLIIENTTVWKAKKRAFRAPAPSVITTTKPEN